MVKKRGGKRPGAGRPVSPATLEAQQQRKLLIEALAPHVQEIVEALAKKAKKGDVAAAKELFDRAWGKAAQPLTGPDDGPIQITGVKIAVRKK